MKILIKADENDVKDGMVKAYENFAKKGGFNVTEKSIFKCTRIEVGTAIDKYFWDYYRKKALENNPFMDEAEIKTGIAMLMLQNGAKRNETIDPWEVVMENDFVVNEE